MNVRVALQVSACLGALTLWEGLAGDARAQNPPTPAPTPPAIVSGVFVDSAGNPIQHAVLSVVGESLRVVTDSTGHFRLLVPPGPKLLAARSLGYRPLMWAVTLVSGQESVQRINLSQLSIMLPGITVVAQRYVPSRLRGFEQRRRLGFGRFMDREQIDRQVVMRAADLLRQIPGVRVDRSRNDPLSYVVSFARCNLSAVFPGATPAHGEVGGTQVIGNSKLGKEIGPGSGPSLGAARTRSSVGVYIDGFRVPGDPGEALSMINANDVEAIEVYRGPSELPAEFMSDDCAAIVIWTRY
jgi:hypothetical protein